LIRATLEQNMLHRHQENTVLNVQQCLHVHAAEYLVCILPPRLVLYVFKYGNRIVPKTQIKLREWSQQLHQVICPTQCAALQLW
jgi:hypothetical protein